MMPSPQKRRVAKARRESRPRKPRTPIIYRGSRIETKTRPIFCPTNFSFRDSTMSHNYKFLGHPYLWDPLALLAPSLPVFGTPRWVLNPALRRERMGIWKGCPSEEIGRAHV